MGFRRLLLLSTLLLPALCQASDGVIRFTGKVVEPTCVVQTVQTDKTEIPALHTCSRDTAANAAVSTEIMTPNGYMVPWRANQTPKPDALVTQWKVISLVYN